MTPLLLPGVLWSQTSVAEVLAQMALVVLQLQRRKVVLLAKAQYQVISTPYQNPLSTSMRLVGGNFSGTTLLIVVCGKVGLLRISFWTSFSLTTILLSMTLLKL